MYGVRPRGHLQGQSRDRENLNAWLCPIAAPPAPSQFKNQTLIRPSEEYSFYFLS